jgi:isoleucyl-tRNA synthetase
MTKKENGKNYKDTLNLPKTDFSMKANLPLREPEMLSTWDKRNIYGAVTSARKDSPEKFILHDGPPYANGHIHVGHVLNKILKDICVKYRSMKGCYAPFVPGWDCHGLPVEHQLLKELDISKHDIDKVEFRKKAYDYALKFVKIQSDEFRRLGIFADWSNPYLTLTEEYEAAILYALADLHEKGYIYRDIKPVNWCPACETALAEAEVEYDDKTSHSIFVKFASDKKTDNKKTFFLVWTTTPWTLPANVAVALHPDFLYSFLSVGEEVWIVASDLVGRVMEKAGISEYVKLRESTGAEIVKETASCRHPFIDRSSVLVLADYVTKEEGTGCVHTAPGHGQDDHFTGKKYSLPTIMPVDDKGRFTEEAGEFAGEKVLRADPAVIERLSIEGTLVKAEKITHSYPHCWRCKKPVISRATKQWFLRVDHMSLREKISDIIEKEVKWVPSSGKERISSMIKNRPDWCLSRQRYWGVPIPAFRCGKCGNSFTDADIIRNVASLTEKEGSNVWFEKDAAELIPEGKSCPHCAGEVFEKENDILDVWFDSGVSHRAVLEARKELSCPADMYLEGSDQHRGWFQAALITSAALSGKAPYRSVLTHGFVVDGEGKKMSKSGGNVVKPEDVMKKYGADILRLWVASSDYETDIKISPEIMERLADGYRKIRNTFRFLLSNLYDFDKEKNGVLYEDMTEADKWMLSRLTCLQEEVTAAYESSEFHKVYRKVYDFCVYEVSALYMDFMKDPLYILPPDSSRRRSHQTVIFHLVNTIARIMAPVLCFTTDEVWGHFVCPGKKESIHLELWPETDAERRCSWRDIELEKKWEKFLVLREGIMKLLEEERARGTIGSALDAAVIMSVSDEKERIFLKDNSGLLTAILKVSDVEIKHGDPEGAHIPNFSAKVKIEKAKGMKCPRCWNYTLTVGHNSLFPDICSRCADAVTERSAV